MLVLLVWQPQLAADAGFAMSALATAALLLIAPGWADALRRASGARRASPRRWRSRPRPIVVTAPVIAAISGRISLVSIPANLLAEPVVAAVTVLGFAAALVAPLWLPGGAFLAQLAGWPCRWLIWVANFFGGLHGATLPWPGGTTGGLALLVVTLALARASAPGRCAARDRHVRRGVGDRADPGSGRRRRLAAAGWIFVACDVGQGDGLVLPAGPHTAVVIDSGPDPVAMDRCLD